MEPSPSGRDDQRKRRASEVFKVARNDLQQVAVSHEEAGSHHTSKYLKISRDNIGNDGTGAVREPNVWESDSGVMKWSGKRQNISVCETTEDEPGSEVHAMSVLAKILSLNVTSLVTSKVYKMAKIVMLYRRDNRNGNDCSLHSPIFSPAHALDTSFKWMLSPQFRIPFSFVYMDFLRPHN